MYCRPAREAEATSYHWHYCPVQEMHKHIRHVEFISPAPTSEKYKHTKIILQDKHSILYSQNCVEQTQSYRCSAKDKKQSLKPFALIYLQQGYCSVRKVFWLRPTLLTLLLHNKCCLWGTTNVQDLIDKVLFLSSLSRAPPPLTATQTISRSRGKTHRVHPVRHAQHAAVVCMQGNYVLPYQQYRKQIWMLHFITFKRLF